MSFEDSGQEAPDTSVDSGQEVQDQQVNNSGEDRFKNLQSEFSRKIENIQQQFQSQSATLEAVLATLQERSAAGTATQAEENLKDLIYDDPDKALEVMERKIASNVDKRLTEQQQRQQKTVQVITQVQAEYPEFKSESSEAYQKALQIHATLPKHLIGTAEGAEMAMLKAASQMGLIPANKRQKQDETEDFTMQGKRGGDQRRTEKKEPSVSQATIDFARLLNPQKSEKDIVEGLKKTVKRDTYRDWR